MAGAIGALRIGMRDVVGSAIGRSQNDGSGNGKEEEGWNEVVEMGG